MEQQPKWDTTAENVMRTRKVQTDPAQLINYDNQIKIIYCQDEDGNTALVSIDASSPAEGPFVIGPFNPNLN